jgi:predicted secreted hydrolase
MFAHFAVTDESGKRFFFSDRIGRAGAGRQRRHDQFCNAAYLVRPVEFAVRRQARRNPKINALARSDASSTNEQNLGLNLTQQALKAPVINGLNGVSQKSAGLGRASHYYSFTRLQTRGTLRIGRETLQVEGQSWFDHEFGSSQLNRNQVGWDWISLQLSDGRDLMLYRLRLKNGGVEPFSSGTLVEKNGSSRHLKRADFSMIPVGSWESPSTKGTYPARWKLAVPSAKLSLEVVPVMPEQELKPRRSGTNLAYWEGLVDARGTIGNRAVTAQGYVEMTGYAAAFGSTF